MRARRALLLITVLAVVLAPSAGLACDKESKTAAGCSVKACPHSAAKAAALASNADAGCHRSAASLIAMARESGCSKAAGLATNAENGDESARTALIAMFKPSVATETTEANGEPSFAQLATWADKGCHESADSLIVRAKASGCSKTAELAARAEGGCEKSKAALIAMFTEDEETEENEETDN